MQPMGLGTSLLLIAVGAVLRFAITVTTKDVNIQTIGVILMIVGGIGLVLTVFWMVISTDHRRSLPRDDDVPPTRVRDPGGRY
jgi:sulfite exporter TauE/SafE